MYTYVYIHIYTYKKTYIYLHVQIQNPLRLALNQNKSQMFHVDTYQKAYQNSDICICTNRYSPFSGR